MLNLPYWKVFVVLFAAQIVINLKPIITIGLMCNGSPNQCGG
jgi:hypothetical protein